MITIPIIAIIIALIVCLIISEVNNQKTITVLAKTRDLLLSMTSGKKLIVKKDYLRKEEIEYLKKLEDIVKDRYIVKPQIHLSDIADVKFGYYDHDNLFYELKRIILDYVIFDQQFKPLVGIELNGRSHLFKSRKSRDKFTENLLNNIGVEYFQINLPDRPDRQTIVCELEKKIELAKSKQVFPKAYKSSTEE